MASLVFAKNPLSPRERKTYALADGERPIDWLQRHYPDGCGGAVRFSVNGAEWPLDELDYVPASGDSIVLEASPADPTGGILTSILISVVLTAASMALQALFAKPTPPAFAQASQSEPSPVYSVRSSQNTARLGEPVPVPYGSVLHTPDMCAQPYSWYFGDREQYFDALMCLGVGDFTVNQILVGDTDVTTIENNAVQVFVAPPAVHLNQVGNLRDVFGVDAPFYEDMLVSVEVGEQEFVDADNSSGSFRMGKSGQTGRFFWVDIAWPGGLYQVMDGGVDVTGTECAFSVSIVEADANGNAIAGTEQNFPFNQFSASAPRDPLRVTFWFDAGYNAMWLCKLTRSTVREPSGGEVNRFIWTGLRMRVFVPGSQYVYGNTTLLCVRFRATALNSAANNQVRVRLQRNLPLLGSGAAVPTNSPADAFVDILTNMDYGARRPLSEVDVDRLATLKAFWNSGEYTNYGFNGVYTGKTTVWEALTDTMQVVAAAPLPLGAFMSVVQDGIKDVRTMLFTEQNMVRDSFALTYSFDKEGDHDGVEVEYRNPATFAPAYVRSPASSADPDKVVLFGCTDSRQASEYSLLLWQRRAGNRRAVSFDTELEGLIPILGERVAVQHTLPRWGQSGFVVQVAADGVTLTLDRSLTYSGVGLSPPFVMVFRDQYGSLSNVVEITAGPTRDVVILASDPWAGTDGDWSLVPTQELTHFAFGDAAHSVKDFILSTLAPSADKHVKISGTYYDPSVYPGTFAFLAFPVPS